MKTILTAVLFLAAIANCNAQTTPPSGPAVPELNQMSRTTNLLDTIDFAPYATGTIINTQYLHKNVVFGGYAGSTDPEVHDYGSASYGRIIHSDTWYNPLSVSFRDSTNPNVYRLATGIEFANVVGVTETDIVSVSLYDSMNVLLYNYISTSPEHVVINYGSAEIAYVVLDDVGGTAYAVDNFFVHFETSSSVAEFSSNNFAVFPNPFSDKVTVSSMNEEPCTIKLFNAQSQIILEEKFSRSTILNTEKFARGFYFYEIRNDVGVVKSGKLIKY